MDAEALLLLAQRAILGAAERRGARSKYVDVNGVQVHSLEVRGWSEGATVFLVHGLGGSSLGWWRVLFRLARRVGRVVAIDLPGAGFSPTPSSGPLGFDAQMAVLESFVERELPERAVFLGQSLGGAMVARLVARRPEKALATILVAPAGGRVPPGRIEEVVQSFQVTTQREARALSKRFFSRPPLLLPYFMGPTLVPLMQRPSVQRLLEDALRTSALEDAELERLPLPLLLLWAKNERVLPPESVAHFRKHLPVGARIEEVEGFGHSPQLDSPRELVKRIVGFLAEALPRNAAA